MPGGAGGLLSSRARWIGLGVLAAVQVGFVFLWVEPGPMVIDEVAYHRMVVSLLDGHGLAVWNGYDEFPSVELAGLYMEPAGDHLAAQYPYGFAFAAAPFYLLFGYRGLFLVNALAFVGVIALCRRVALQLVGDERVALGAAALFAAATYGWQYSQAVWPHSLALLAVLGAASLAIEACETPDRARAVRCAAGAGLLAGLAVTVRLDAALALAGMVLPLLVAAPLRGRELFALVAGALPGFAALSVMNWMKWGNPSPFTYGDGGGLAELARYAPLGAVGAAGLAALVGATRARSRAWIRAHRRAVAAGALGVALVAAALPASRGAVADVARGAHVILADVRELPLDQTGPAMRRSESGAVEYFGALKKALLQSVPYLPLVLVPIAAAVRSARSRRLLLLAGFYPLTLAVFFSTFMWHGGLCLDMRYLLPALPFTCVLAACALAELGRACGRRWGLVFAAGATAAAGLYASVRSAGRGIPGEHAVYVTPLVLALLLALAIAVWSLGRGRWAAVASVAVAGSAVAWAALIEFDYDAAWLRRFRAVNHRIAADTARHVAPDSLLFADMPDRFYGVIEYRARVRVAIPVNDRFRDAGALARFHQAAGRRVYGALTPTWWTWMQESGALDGMELRPIALIGAFRLAEIRPRGGAPPREEGSP